MFFKRKKRDEDENLREEFEVVPASVEGTIPGAVEDTPGSQMLSVPSFDQNIPMAADAPIRLFPGFEREDFEVGFAPDGPAPSLVMRWKDGGEWFTMPNMFNRAILSAMDERECANDLPRLLRSYGYDVNGEAS
jgi:hypothetical protein